MWQVVGLKTRKVYFENKEKSKVIRFLNQQFPSNGKSYPIYLEGDFYNILPEALLLYRKTG